MYSLLVNPTLIEKKVVKTMFSMLATDLPKWEKGIPVRSVSPNDRNPLVTIIYDEGEANYTIVETILYFERIMEHHGRPSATGK